MKLHRNKNQKNKSKYTKNKNIATYLSNHVEIGWDANEKIIFTSMQEEVNMGTLHK